MTIKDIAILFLVVGCGGMEGTSTESAPVLTSSRVSPDVIVNPLTREAFRKVSRGSIVSTELSPGRFSAGELAEQELVPFDGGRVLLSLLISCALPSDVTVVDSLGIEYFGELELAPGWLRHPLREEGEGWVSACLLAKMSGRSLALPISLRGPNPALRASRDERSSWTLQEGAFFGNLFSPEANLFACKGSGNSPDRVCTTEDPSHDRGLTLCGLISVGPCEEVCDLHHTFFTHCLHHDEVITTYLSE